jgi:hypothetical protein
VIYTESPQFPATLRVRGGEREWILAGSYFSRWFSFFNLLHQENSRTA